VVLANITKKLANTKPIGYADEIVLFEKPIPGKTYLIGVDPATGSGNDYTAFQVFSFPDMNQVAEFRSNTMSSPVAYRILKRLFRIFTFDAPIYFSVENNGVGEGIIALYEADEDPPPLAEFISEDGKNRKGMATTARSKLKACLALKEMIERGTMGIRSKALLSELKQYVRHAGSYAAKRGATDDLISAALIITRLVNELASFDQNAYEKIFTYTPSFSEFSAAVDYGDNEGCPIVV